MSSSPARHVAPLDRAVVDPFALVWPRRPAPALARIAVVHRVLVVSLLTRCGGGGSGDAPTQPPPSATTAALTSVTVTASASTLALGDPVSLSAVPTFGSGTAPAVTLAWTRHGSAGGTLGPDASGLTAAYASAAGTVGVDTIVVTATASSGPSAAAPVTATVVLAIRGPHVARVAYSGHLAYVGVGASFAFPATGRDAGGAAVAQATSTYQSLTPSVVTVAADGTLSGVSTGSALVVATAYTARSASQPALPTDTLRVVVTGDADARSIALSDTLVQSGASLTLVGAAIGTATVTLDGQPLPVTGATTVSAGLAAVTVTPPPSLFATCQPLGTTVALAIGGTGASAGRTVPLAVFAPQTVTLTPGQDVALTAATTAGCPVAVANAGTYVVMPFAWDRGLANGGTAGTSTPTGATTALTVRAGAAGMSVASSRAALTRRAARVSVAPLVLAANAGMPQSDVLVATIRVVAPRSARGLASAAYPPTWSGGACPIPTVLGDAMPVGTLRDAQGRFVQAAATATYGGTGVSEPWTLAAITPSVAVFFDSALVRARAGMPGADARVQLFAGAYDSTVTPLLRDLTEGVPDADGNGRVVVLVALHAGAAYAYPTGYSRDDCVANGFVLGEAINLGGDAFVTADNLVAPAVSVAAHETGHVIDNAQRYNRPAIRQDTWWSREGYAVLLQHLWSLAGANGGHVPSDAFTGNRSAAAYRTIGGTPQGGYCERPERGILTTWYTLSADGYPLACQAVRYLLGQLALQQPGLTPRDLMVRWSQLRDRRHFADAAGGLWGAASSPAGVTGDWYLSWAADGVAGAREPLQDPSADLRSLYRVWWPQNAYPAPVATLGLGASLALTLGEPDAAPIQTDLPARGWFAVTGPSSAAVPTDRMDVRLLRLK